MQERLIINKIAVLGAGVMGAQIAAHCVNAKIETLLFDLPSKEGGKNAIVDKAIAHLSKLKPSPLGTEQTVKLIKACNYDENLAELRSCDLIIEAIGERMDWKLSLYERIAPYVTESTILATNTSGLSIRKLAQSLPENLRSNFCGMHFFNPPRYMHLVELIPSSNQQSEILDKVEAWLTSYLGKGVVRAYDTPNFIANRIGVFSLLACMYHAEQFNIGLDEVDALTGSLLGRPKSATFRTMDVVGLDTMKHVVDTMKDQLTEDPWHSYFKLPSWLQTLISEGKLGQKSEQGIYRKSGKIIEVFDLQKKKYRPADGMVVQEVKEIFRIADPAERMEKLLHSTEKQAQFLAACLLDLYQYCAFHLQTIADSVRDIDLAMCWGFGWSEGPFESWQKANLYAVRTSIQESIAREKSMSSVPLPAWLEKIAAFYTEQGAFCPAKNTYQPRNQLSVYRRQIFPVHLPKEAVYKPEILFENDAVRVSKYRDQIAVAEFKTKANTISQLLIDGLNKGLDIAEKQGSGFIIYQDDADNFSSGADIKALAALLQNKDMQGLEKLIESFQRLAMRMKYSPVPTIAALRGRALGGGCELMLHCSRVVSAFESYPGLVEAGIGVIPAGGGTKEMAMRAAESAVQGNLMDYIKVYFQQIATGQVSGSAADARQRGYLKATDVWLMHKQEVLQAALEKVNSMRTENYRPALPAKFKVAGREGHAILQSGLVNWLEGGFISKHDYTIANELAFVLCGGDLYEGELVDEAWLLKLERDAFIKLASTAETKARISHFIETGKILRN